MIKTSQRGFTLIELVVVIVILGILAAFAVPRFMGLENEARVATVNSLAGSLRSAAAMAHGVCMARGCTNGQTINLQGQNVTFTNGYPNLATIDNAMETIEGFTVDQATGRFTRTGARTAANCWVQYNLAPVNGPPTLTFAGGPNPNTIQNTLRNNC